MYARIHIVLNIIKNIKTPLDILYKIVYNSNGVIL